ncbi:MAG: hypothetical protein WBQ53_11020 [Methylocystis sp.]
MGWDFGRREIPGTQSRGPTAVGIPQLLELRFVDKKRAARTAANRRSLAAPLRFRSSFDEGAGLDPIACRRIGAVFLRGCDRPNKDQEERDH